MVTWIANSKNDQVRAALRKRGMDLLAQRKVQHSVVKVGDLFGDNIDGICVVFDGHAFEEHLRRKSPPQFESVLPAIVQASVAARGSGFDSDIKFWFVYAVKGAHIQRTYEISFKSVLDMNVPDGDGGRCFLHRDSAGLHFYPNPHDEGTLFIDIPPQKIQ